MWKILIVPPFKSMVPSKEKKAEEGIAKWHASASSEFDTRADNLRTDPVNDTKR